MNNQTELALRVPDYQSIYTKLKWIIGYCYKIESRLNVSKLNSIFNLFHMITRWSEEIDKEIKENWKKEQVQAIHTFPN